MAYFLQQIANAAPVAALYAALAFGYSIAFAVTRRADVAYGALFAFAAQMFILFSGYGWDRLWLVLPAALGFGAVVALLYGVGAGLVVGRHVMRPLAFSSDNTVVVAALGVVLVLMETARLAADTRSLWLPPFLNTPVVLWGDPAFPVALTVLQLANTAAMAAIVLAGHVFLARSAWGRRWRAVSEDRQAAELCGVDTAGVYLSAYALAALIASLTGILAVSYYGNMDFGGGLVFGVKVLFIAAIGGAGTPLLSALGGAAMGLAETLWSAYGEFLWRDLVIFSALVLLLVIFRRERPVP
ncbi:branched-chain amino acid ABC transporter permease [Shinella yambaruensis]|uniref:Branched-chain amino acid ABC transporter permease n=1 Tax=Shinella yambaruensis TaxID=415996 RepID=A0ABQ5ZGA9_9HYPH|nr:branched-chain amino acid ABC transporter permease [Shinella yambaruensis]MCJ8024490.1 branched-chain amino acid ABC transporter permease [Shinella yambaruensis]MCU7980932.1 branched-chain amino acid ABC transporter permease [Shinella yambaruensis]GLR49794.1 branched-chain amino acid ABC transporter permease [Shinella yambaruensis]